MKIPSSSPLAPTLPKFHCLHVLPNIFGDRKYSYIPKHFIFYLNKLDHTTYTVLQFVYLSSNNILYTYLYLINFLTWHSIIWFNYSPMGRHGCCVQFLLLPNNASRNILYVYTHTLGIMSF